MKLLFQTHCKDGRYLSWKFWKLSDKNSLITLHGYKMAELEVTETDSVKTFACHSFLESFLYLNVSICKVGSREHCEFDMKSSWLQT